MRDLGGEKPFSLPVLAVPRTCSCAARRRQYVTVGWCEAGSRFGFRFSALQMGAAACRLPPVRHLRVNGFSIIHLHSSKTLLHAGATPSVVVCFMAEILSLPHLFLDSDGDTFVSLKKPTKSDDNGLSKSAAAGPDKKAASAVRSPPKSASAPVKGKVKSPPTPATPKATPPHPKQSHTSVLDFFGSSSIQRSAKKLVASTKRKAVSRQPTTVAVH